MVSQEATGTHEITPSGLGVRLMGLHLNQPNEDVQGGAPENSEWQSGKSLAKSLMKITVLWLSVGIPTC